MRISTTQRTGGVTVPHGMQWPNAQCKLQYCFSPVYNTVTPQKGPTLKSWNERQNFYYCCKKVLQGRIFVRIFENYARKEEKKRKSDATPRTVALRLRLRRPITLYARDRARKWTNGHHCNTLNTVLAVNDNDRSRRVGVVLRVCPSPSLVCVYLSIYLVAMRLTNDKLIESNDHKQGEPTSAEVTHVLQYRTVPYPMDSLFFEFLLGAGHGLCTHYSTFYSTV